MIELVSNDQDNAMVPGFMISIALNFVASRIGEYRGCAVLDNDPQDQIARLECPLVYLAARSDTICPLSKARSLFKDYRRMLVIKQMI